MTAVELVADLLMVAGAVLTLAAGVGLVGFGDALSRLHAATKPQVLGLLCVLAALAVHEQRWATVFALLPVLVFQLLTAPIAAHMVGRAAYRTGNFRPDLLVTDELADAVKRAGGSAPDGAASATTAPGANDGS